MSDAVYYCDRGAEDDYGNISDSSSWGFDYTTSADNDPDSDRSSSSSSSSDEATVPYFWSDKRMTRHEVKLVNKHFSVAFADRDMALMAIEIFEPQRTTDDLPLPPWDFIESLMKGTLLFFFLFL